MNDNHLQQVLLQAAVPPPEQVWEKMSIELEERKADLPLQQKLLVAETDVPALNWDEIAQRLNDAGYAEKLTNAESAAPVIAWNQISQRLTDEIDEAVAAKLISATENPPASVWPAIEQQLSEKTTAKIIPFRKKYAAAFRFAAAAVITGILAWGAYRLLNTKESAGEIAVVAQPAETKENKKSPVAEISKEAPVEVVPVTSSSRSVVKKRIKEELSANNTIAYQEPVNHGSEMAIALRNNQHKAQKPSSQTNDFSESQYLVVLNKDGELIRVSKKLGNLACAKTDAEIPVDAAAAIQSKNCNEQIRQWQERIATSTAISPSAGYIDLNELLLATEK